MPVAEQIYVIAGKGGNVGSFRAMLWTATVYERLRKLKAEGKTAQEAAVRTSGDDSPMDYADISQFDS